MKKAKATLTQLILKETDDKRRAILKHLLALYNDEPSKRLVFTIKRAAEACDVSNATFRKILRELSEENVIFFKTSFEGTTIEFI